MNIHISRQVGSNAMFLSEMEFVLYIEIMCSWTSIRTREPHKICHISRHCTYTMHDVMYDSIHNSVAPYTHILALFCYRQETSLCLWQPLERHIQIIRITLSRKPIPTCHLFSSSPSFKYQGSATHLYTVYLFTNITCRQQNAVKWYQSVVQQQRGGA